MLIRLFFDTFIRLARVISSKARNLILLVLLVALTANCKNGLSEEESVEKVTVSELKNPIRGNSSLPRLFSNGQEIYLSWVTQMDTLSILNYTVYENGTWSSPEFVNAGTDWFVNWADFPAIAENNYDLLTSYLRKSDTATYAYDVRLNLQFTDVSRALDTIGSKNFPLHNDGTKTEHGFVSMVPYGEKSFFVSWLDGRNTGGSHGHEEHGPGAMTLRGAVVSAFDNVSNDAELDNRVCDCCQTSATITQNGPLVAYRDRSEEEIRDISVVRQVNGQWQEPQTIGNDNWQIAGCPVNGPSVDTFDNVVGLAWFTATRGEGEVQLIFSEDNGATFGDPIRIDSGNATGRVDLVMLNDSEAAILWMEPEGEDEVIRVMKVNSEGKKGQLITVSRTSPERASGFPQMEKLGEKLMFAWTDVSGDTSSIKTAVLSLDKL